MRNADYWRGRFSILEDSAHREAQKTIQDMEELYLDAQRTVQKEIESWYARFAGNNPVSYTHLDVYKRQLLQLRQGQVR